MANLLQTGAAFLVGQMKAHAGTSVVYSRGSLSVPLTAVKGRTNLRLSDGGVSRRVVTDLDILVDPADLVIGGQQTDPQRADTVRIADPATGLVDVYEVRTVPGEPEWRWSDQSHTLYRIRLKHVGQEPA